MGFDMASIEKLPSGSYRARAMYKGQMYRITFDHKPTQKEITITLSEQMQEERTAKNGTFEKCALDYIRDRSNVLSPSSDRTYNTRLNQLSDGFKKSNLYDISTTDVQREINRFAKTHAPKTTRDLHGFISAVLGAYRPNFKLNTTLPQKKREKRYRPIEDDVKRILEAAEGTEDSIGFQLGVLSLRCSEICALTMDDLDGNKLYVHRNLVYNKGWKVKETPKTDAGNRTVYLPDKLAEEIREKGYFFKYTPNKLNLHLQKYQDKLKISRFRFHDLRHYFATYASRIMPEADAMALGGWKSDYVFKEIYREAAEDKQQESAEKFISNFLP